MSTIERTTGPLTVASVRVPGRAVPAVWVGMGDQVPGPVVKGAPGAGSVQIDLAADGLWLWRLRMGAANQLLGYVDWYSFDPDRPNAAVVLQVWGEGAEPVSNVGRVVYRVHIDGHIALDVSERVLVLRMGNPLVARLWSWLRRR